MKSFSPTRSEVTETPDQPENVSTDENLIDTSAVEMSSPTENSAPEVSNVSSPKNTGAQKRRNLSGNSDVDNSKKQNLNDTSDSIYNQLELEFEKDTPHWAQLLVISFDALRRDFSEVKHGLTEKLASFESKLENISSRLDSIENESVSAKNSITSLQQNFETHKENSLALEQSVEFVSVKYDDLKKEFHSLTTKNVNLEKIVENLADQIDSNEQHNRNECLLLHGVPESDKETPNQSKVLFAKHISQDLGIKMQENCIKRAHRLGKKRSNGKPRPIIVRLYDPQLRNDIYFNKKALKGKPVSITESLTKHRMQVKQSAEQTYGEKNVWSKEGRIYAKDSSGQIKTILA